eukprot:TRINITY_DN332_c0_g1_i1.p1 TRINITY_DN332_c0_g1~~TRINITY_DN332_c0_g1_i1.p1  ORF type:complete len:171 (-),score=37.13 TRINITY_DN332_c0_g1_i1:47-559(-)
MLFRLGFLSQTKNLSSTQKRSHFLTRKRYQSNETKDELVDEEFYGYDNGKELLLLEGVPLNQFHRVCRIYVPSRESTTQYAYKPKWVIQFLETEKWSGNIMGWTGTNDGYNGHRIEFSTKEQAIQFATSNGFKYEVEESSMERKVKHVNVRSYDQKFTYKGPDTAEEELF